MAATQQRRKITSSYAGATGAPQKQQFATPVHANGRRPFERTAQSSNGFGITTTSPGFYSPPHTASAWQIPTNRKEVYAWAKYWYNNEAYVATSIDFYANFSMCGYKLECSNGAVREYYEKLCKEKLELDKWLPKIAFEYFLYGDVIPMLEIDCSKCHGTNVDPHGNLCDHEGATWSRLSVFDPNTIEISPASFVSQEPIINWLPNDSLVDICTKGKPEEIYNQIPPEVRDKIKSKQPIKLDPKSVTHIKCSASPYDTYGTSLLRRLFPTLAYRDKLRQAQWIVAERHILPIKIVKVGSDTRPASEEDLSAVQEQLALLSNDPLITLVVHHAFEFEWVGAAGKVLQLTQEYEMIVDEILGGMQMNKAIVHGEGPNYASAQVGLDALASKLGTFRNEIKSWIEQKIFKPIAEWNNFTSNSPKGTQEIIYPSIVFNDMGLKDNNQEIANLLQLRARNEVSLQTLLSKFDIDYDDEVERLRQEEMGNMLTSPELGLGSGEGADIGGGGMPPMGGGGGMPPMGGDMGGDMGAPPGGDMGAPPPGGDMAPMAALDMIRMRRTASSDFNKSMCHLTDTEITARSNLGEILPEADYIEMDPDWLPYTTEGCTLGGMVHLARTNRFIQNKYIQHLASRDAKDKNRDSYRKYFNKAEMALFDAIVQVNQKGELPLAFVAQYFVGSNPKLNVDGAFPGVKVAVEVDGQTWHTNEEQIQKDMRKDHNLWSLGWVVLRFTEDEVKEKIDQVIKVIQRVVMDRYNQSNS